MFANNHQLSVLFSKKTRENCTRLDVRGNLFSVSTYCSNSIYTCSFQGYTILDIFYCFCVIIYQQATKSVRFPINIMHNFFLDLQQKFFPQSENVIATPK